MVDFYGNRERVNGKSKSSCCDHGTDWVRSLADSGVRTLHWSVFISGNSSQKGMGADAGNILLDKALRKIFGVTIDRTVKAGLLNSDIEHRFRLILRDRNWLVHKSREQSRNAIHSDLAKETFIHRIDAMAAESLALLFEIGDLAEMHVKKLGISPQQIDAAAKNIFKQ